jgi:hypothetical protein
VGRLDAAPGRSLPSGDCFEIFVDLEHYDQQLAPETNADQAADKNSEARPKVHTEYTEHGRDSTHDHPNQASPVEQRDDLGCQHGVEEKYVFHNKVLFVQEGKQATLCEPAFSVAVAAAKPQVDQ